MDRGAPSASVADEDVGRLADQMRQALHTCSVHTVGPLAAYERCTAALDQGRIDAQQFQEIGRRLVAISEERMHAYAAQGEHPDNSPKIRREKRLIGFVDALFALGLRKKKN
uniref:PtnB n=1 Tax=Streptomyces pathocidini TaxID=1650571 RepID=A0A6G9KGS5_9ACTN|nr:PtnB [Streptomyces pathocidini]